MTTKTEYFEIKTINELRDKISELKEKGYRPSKSDYFQFLNSYMNMIICCKNENDYVVLDYIGG